MTPSNDETGDAPETAVTKQTVLNGMSCKFGGKTPVRIHFMDNSSKMFLLDDAVLVRDAVGMVLEKLCIADDNSLAVVPYFGIFECMDGKTIGAAIPPETVLAQRVQEAVDVAYKLVFMIRLYMPSIWGIEFRDFVARRLEKPVSFLSDEVYLESADVTDEELLRVQYIQAIYYVITGQYYTSEAQILKLAAFQFYYKFGAYKPNVHRTGFLHERVLELVPLRHLKDAGFEAWEHKLFEYIQGSFQYEHHFESQAVAQRRFMDEIYSLDSYGRTFFKLSAVGLVDEDSDNKDGKEPRKVLLGVHAGGVDIYEKSISRGILCSFSYGELLSWGYSCSTDCVYLKLPNVDPVERKPYAMLGPRGSIEFSPYGNEEGPEGGGFDTETSTGKTVSDLMTDYALSFVRESAFEEERGHCDDNYDHLTGDEGLHADVGPDVIPGMSEDVEDVEVLSSAPKGAVFSPRAALEKAKAEAHQKPAINPLHAATRIQALFRGYSVRMTFLRERCAEFIQALWRGAIARTHFSEFIAELMDAEEGSSIAS